MKIKVDVRCFVVASVGALCGLLCWIEVPNAIPSKSTPPSFFVVLLMVFFLVVLNFLVLFFVFFNLP